MTDEEILAELRNNKGRTLVVKDTWYFTGKSMSCSNSGDFNCCEDYYNTFQEALEMIRDLAGTTGTIEKL